MRTAGGAHFLRLQPFGRLDGNILGAWKQMLADCGRSGWRFLVLDAAKLNSVAGPVANGRFLDTLRRRHGALIVVNHDHMLPGDFAQADDIDRIVWCATKEDVIQYVDDSVRALEGTEEPEPGPVVVRAAEFAAANAGVPAVVPEDFLQEDLPIFDGTPAAAEDACADAPADGAGVAGEDSPVDAGSDPEPVPEPAPAAEFPASRTTANGTNLQIGRAHV